MFEIKTINIINTFTHKNISIESNIYTVYYEIYNCNISHKIIKSRQARPYDWTKKWSIGKNTVMTNGWSFPRKRQAQAADRFL